MGPLARIPLRYMSPISLLPKPPTAFHLHREISSWPKAGVEKRMFSLRESCRRLAVGHMLRVKSSSCCCSGRNFSASITCSAQEMSFVETPQKAPRQPRKRVSKLKTRTAPVETPHSIGLQVSAPSAASWSEVELWVVFSDLHFCRRTRDTCLQVLDAVHAEAVARNAGIIFLGDFWHARGSLPVDLLNVVIAQLAKWTRPAVFIPGNHDQVNMSGQMHSLMVLGAVNPLIKVFDEPVEFLNALWVPFRRDHSLIKQALNQHPNVIAIFAHLDVVGAYMNEASQAKEGMEASAFPKKIPIFTGHYHKPHVVNNTQIEYIGSPYQISASETGQAKRFLLLNNLWEKVGEIPIDVGGRHFVISSADELVIENVENLRRGDRLRLLLSTTALQEPLKADVERLQSMGIDIDLVFPTLTSKPRIEEAETLDAFGLFDLYAERVKMSSGAKVKGVDMLRNMDIPAKLIQRPQVCLVLQHVEMEGFGPYLELVTYPLAQRGIRVVCGRNMDSTGADSNGAGKSTLVMAPLWALSGSTDPRPESMRGLSTSDVIHEKAKIARVRVEGMVNDRSFFVERTAGRKSSLKFYIDGEDCTGQDIKLTQAKIDELIDSSMLQRVAFHGQYGIGGLLEATDKDFKDELSRIIAMDLWFSAKKQSLQELRSKQTEVDYLEGVLTQLQQQKEHIARKVEESQIRIQEWEETQELRRLQILEETQAEVGEVGKLLAKCVSEFQNIQKKVLALEDLVHGLEQMLLAEMETWHRPGSANETAAELDKIRRESLMTKAAELAVELRNAEVFLRRHRNKFNDYKLEVCGLEVCDKCLQPIDSQHYSKNLAQLFEELNAAEEAYKKRVDDERTTRTELLIISKAISDQTRRGETDLRQRRQESVKRRNNVNCLRKYLTTVHSILSPIAQFLESELPLSTISKGQNIEDSQASKHPDNDGRGNLYFSMESFNGGEEQETTRKCYELEAEIKVVKRLQTKVEQSRQILIGLKNMSNPFSSEYDALKSLGMTLRLNLEQKQDQYRDAQIQAGWLKELDMAFGHTGVQSYVLETALTELQERTARFLEILSGGSLGLLLRPTKELKRSKASVETIDRVALVRLSSGIFEQRSLRQLSGGERRRQALALTLGFAEFAAQRSGLHCDLMVLDEVLQHLDSEGKARMVAVLKGLPQSTILVVSQMHGDVADAFDHVDIVVKQNDTARIESIDSM